MMKFQSTNKKIASVVTAALLLLSFCAFISCFDETRSTSSSSHYASLNDIQVHYILKGKGDKTLLFIHGWSCDTTFWKAQIDFFKKDYRVIAINLPGHGKSSKPEIPYTFDLFADAVREVIDDAGIDKVFLVGHSMGYPVARHFIRKYPQRVSGLCIVDGAYFRVPSEPDKFAEWKKQIDGYVQSLKSDNRKEFLNQFLASLFVEESPSELKAEIKAKMFSAPEHVANSAMEEMVRPENWKEYPLNVPTLAVYAVSPDLPSDNEEYLRSLFPQMEYHQWDKVGHFVMMEQPERFNKLLSEYLSKQLVSPPLLSSYPCVAVLAWTTGIFMVNVVPLPTSLET
ncbi:MAG: alpha/beta hydrolase [Nitrospiraceae bacterium]|nr:MAG: alpha/beta hydrolase [Nitrospiraceae bacterium]